ncbi:hypothetical protein SAY86_019359 [Trapa natans]|uniref:Uncharacterized protein n=1 Tax=Trapa natans TaxID=22666 RepID=A0AAN7LLQ3_TRANT|nr:hypothetical protein SAY86_019359 [Trapa natans]
MFLILMGIITRYYIYPIDHNTNQHFSTSSKSVLHVLVMCICIAAVGSMAVLANKRGDVKQIKNLESSTSAYASVGGSPRSDSPTQCGDELESLPHHSILQCTNLHFGARPDLTSYVALLDWLPKPH